MPYTKAPPVEGNNCCICGLELTLDNMLQKWFHNDAGDVMWLPLCPECIDIKVTAKKKEKKDNEPNQQCCA